MKNHVRSFFGLARWSNAGAVLALCAFTSVSRAGLYDITFDGLGSGQIDVESGAAVSGSLVVTGTSSPDFDGTYALTSGAGNTAVFTYDSVVNVGSDPFLDSGGLLFTSGAEQVDFYATEPGTYFLSYSASGATINGGYEGGATLSAVPEPTNYALAAFGLIFVSGGVGRFYLKRFRSVTTS